MPEAPRTIAVTGATGFVGRYVVARLLEEPRLALRCLVRSTTDVPVRDRKLERVSWVRGDVRDPSTLPVLVEGAWGVINLAGYRDFWSRDRDTYYAVNTRGAQHVFEAALDARVDKVVQVSTPLAFGMPSQVPFDESSTPGPHSSDYAKSKHLGDSIGWTLYTHRGLPLTVVYLAAVVGAGDVSPTMEVRRAVLGKVPALVGADTVFTYVYVRDAAEAIVRALLRDSTVGRRYLIGTERASTREYFRLIGELAGVPIPNRNLPERALLPFARALEWVARCTGRRPALPVDVLTTTDAGSLLFDGNRAVEELGLRYTPLRDALREAVDEIRFDGD